MGSALALLPGEVVTAILSEMWCCLECLHVNGNFSRTVAASMDSPREQGARVEAQVLDALVVSKMTALS